MAFLFVLMYVRNPGLCTEYHKSKQPERDIIVYRVTNSPLDTTLEHRIHRTRRGNLKAIRQRIASPLAV